MATKKNNGIKEIARLAGVSTATVSRVLNGNKSVAPGLTARVLEIAGQLGYQPSPAARYMRSKKSGLLGIVVPKLSLAYFSDIINGAIDKANQYGQMMIVGTVEGRSSTEQEFLHKISHYMLDGLIYCPVSAHTSGKEAMFLEHIPLVVAGRRKVMEGVPHVSTDDEKAGYIATSYLLRLGRENIAYFAGFWEEPPFDGYTALMQSIDSELSGSYSTLDRLRGYRRALNEKGLVPDEKKMVFSGFDAESGYEASQELLGRLDRVDGLIVPNCYVARGVYRFFQEQGISIPEDIALVSMDDLNLGEMLTIPTTSIIHDMFQVGVEAVEQVNRLIDKEPTRDTLIDVKLRIRQSTAHKSSVE